MHEQAQQHRQTQTCAHTHTHTTYTHTCRKPLSSRFSTRSRIRGRRATRMSRYSRNMRSTLPIRATRISCEVHPPTHPYTHQHPHTRTNARRGLYLAYELQGTCSKGLHKHRTLDVRPCRQVRGRAYRHYVCVCVCVCVHVCATYLKHAEEAHQPL